MQITPINNLNFKAQYIGTSAVLKKDAENNYRPCDANFVEFKLTDKNDVKKIEEICSMPEFCSFGEEIKEQVAEATMPYYTNYKNSHCYALLKETETNYDNINKENVLGIFLADESYDDRHPHKIEYFITSSQYSNNKVIKPQEKYSGIGTAMINAFKNLYPKKSIGLYASWAAIKFWNKNGFNKINDLYMIYNPKE